MRIRVKPSRRRQDRVTLSMASMIDVVFLLLAYFIVTSGFNRPEDRLTPLLQTRQAGRPTDMQAQRVDVLQIDGQPSYRVGNNVMRSRDELHSTLARLPKEPGLFVQVHDDVLVSFAVSAVQIARDAGFEQVTYVAAK